MTAPSNLRQNPLTGSFSYRDITGESKTIGEFDFLPGIYGFLLDDRPDPDLGTITITEDVSGGIVFELITTGSPLQGQARVFPDRGIVICNSADDAMAVAVDYRGAGTNNSLENINSIIQDFINSDPEIESASPKLSLFNTTAENTDGGRLSEIDINGTKTSGQKHTLARIKISHDGSGDDHKGKIEILLNDGDDLLTPSLSVLKLLSSGLLELPKGQIKFPATQNASSDANTLDDYEEADFTPNIGGTATYTKQQGRYCKIGNKVFCQIDLRINTIGTGSPSIISGLPFTNNGTYLATANAPYFASLSSNIYTLGGFVALSSTNLVLVGTTSAAATVTDPLSILQSGSIIILNFFYEV